MIIYVLSDWLGKNGFETFRLKKYNHYFIHNILQGLKIPSNLKHKNVATLMSSGQI